MSGCACIARSSDDGRSRTPAIGELRVGDTVRHVETRVTGTIVKAGFKEFVVRWASGHGSLLRTRYAQGSPLVERIIDVHFNVFEVENGVDVEE